MKDPKRLGEHPASLARLHTGIESVMEPIRRFSEQQRDLLAHISGQATIFKKDFERIEQQRDMFAKISAPAGIARLFQKDLDGIAAISRQLDVLRSVASIPELPNALGWTKNFQELNQLLSDPVPRWLKELKAPVAEWLALPHIAHELAKAIPSSPAISGLRFASLSEPILNNVDWARVGDSIHAPVAKRKALKAATTRMADAYADLLDDAASSPSPQGDELFNGLSRDMYLAARAVEVVATPLRVQGDPAPEPALDRDLVNSIRAGIDELLDALDSGLRRMLAGAREAILATNSDRVRHIAVSLRELMTHVLHRLAPDEAVRGWTTDPAHFHNGRPTRRARLLYICRAASNRAPDFSVVDVDATLRLMDLLQSGTHAIQREPEDEYIIVMFSRTESTLLGILKYHFLAHADMAKKD